MFCRARSLQIPRLSGDFEFPRKQHIKHYNLLILLFALLEISEMGQNVAPLAGLRGRW
jgi:hypothetical protein